MGRRGPPTSHLNTNDNLGGEAFTIWRDLHQKLSHLAELEDQLPEAAHDLSLLSNAPSVGPGSIEHLVHITLEQVNFLELCLERLGILIALREAPPDPPQQGRSTKKRRLEAGTSEPIGSPVSSSHLLEPIASTSRTSSPGSLNQLSSHPARSQVASRATTPITEPSRRDTRASALSKLARRAAVPRDQLPLLPGRLVAFKRSRKPGDGSLGSDSECWIMARVVRSISNDKNRYQVEDVDVEGSASEADTTHPRRRSSWNTTLKSIIPLPMPDQPHTFPSTPLAPGTDVLGLYPDTTTFYLGKIKSGPSEKGRKYRVCFEDDGQTGPVPVGMEHVVALI